MKQYIVDAFTEEVFKGNPAAVCVMEEWLNNETMLNIAKENNLSDTAFLIKNGENYDIRWFTPGAEIDLCGHATLASAFVINQILEKGKKNIIFHSKSGEIEVNIKEELLEIDFPAFELKQIQVTEEMENALGIRPKEAYLGRDLICILEEDQVRNLKPDQKRIEKLPGVLFHVTSEGEKYDSVSRTFAPKHSVAEDPVCGSGHCHLFPLWAQKKGKDTLIAYQASARGGVLYGKVVGKRVLISGKAVLFSEAEIKI